MTPLSFDQFAEFIREYWHVSWGKSISPETQFERDLGLTGDDGADLLEATERKFGVILSDENKELRETFNLEPNEYLFHSEGLDLFSPFQTIFGRDVPTVREIHRRRTL